MIITTGVLGGNGVGWLWQEEFIDLNYETAMDERRAELEAEEIEEEEIDEILEKEFEDFQGETHLYGGWKKVDGLWEPDEEADYAAIYNNNDNVIQVVWSKFYMETHYCSPCYPAQGDLDTPGDYYNAYCLPADLMNEEWLKEHGHRIKEHGQRIDN